MNEEPSLDQLDCEQLAARVQQGCEHSFVELDRRYRPRLMHLLDLRLGNAADAEDVTQQTLLRVFEKIGRYDAARSFAPWVFTIALRLATDHQRRRRNRAISDPQRLDSVVDRAIGPAERVATQEQHHELWAVVRRVLKPNQQTALWLFYGEQHSVAQIAQATGRTSISVRVLLYRARKALAPHLQEHVPPATDKLATEESRCTPEITVGVQS